MESMQVLGMTPEPRSDDTLDSHKSGATDPGNGGNRSAELGGGDNSSAAMARCNSSHGGFPSSGKFSDWSMLSILSSDWSIFRGQAPVSETADLRSTAATVVADAETHDQQCSP